VDPVTHTLTGVTAANAFFRRRVGPAAIPILAVAANLPDVDAVMHLIGGPAAITFRRTFGHSVFLIPLWAAALALLFRLLYPHIRFRALYLLCLFGAAMHVFFDLVNSFGVVVLWPFSDWRPELAIVFIIDLALTGLLAAPLVISIAKRARPHIVLLSRASVAAVAIYLGLCGAGRAVASRNLAEAAAGSGGVPDFTYVFPEPLGPSRWRGVVREGDRYRLYLIHVPGGTAEAMGGVGTDPGDPAVREILGSPLGLRLASFFKAPVWEVRREGGAADVSAWDLRFDSLLLGRAPVFRYEFRVHEPEGAAGRPGAIDVLSW